MLKGIYLVLTVFVYWLSLYTEAVIATPHRRRAYRTVCHIADSIRQEGSDKYLLWKDERPFPSLEFPFVGYNKSWMIFVTPYRGVAMLQFAHGTRDGRCQFLMKRSSSNLLVLTAAMECHPENINRNTLFSTTMGGSELSTGISFSHSSHRMFIGHHHTQLVLTSHLDVKHMIWWRINLSKTKQCPQM